MKKPISRVDLNLLVALEVLLEERSVSRAAERLFITQPAMSKTLQRLRVLFDDPLFTRVSHGLAPTPRALELRDQLPPVLNAITDMVDAIAFDPAKHFGNYRIAAHDVFASHIFTTLMVNLSKSAPNMTIGNPTSTINYPDKLATGEYDFCISHELPSDKKIHAFPLREAGGVCIVRKDHPLAKRRKITMKDYLKYQHISFVVRNNKTMGLVDQLLEKMGLSRNVAFETNSLFTAAKVVANSDYILSISDFVARQYQDESIAVLPVPPELQSFQVPLLLLQHERTRTSTPHKWIREQIIAAI